jgi:hypothetical protein
MDPVRLDREGGVEPAIDDYQARAPRALRAAPCRLRHCSREAQQLAPGELALANLEPVGTAAKGRLDRRRGIAARRPAIDDQREDRRGRAQKLAVPSRGLLADA